MSRYVVDNIAELILQDTFGFLNKRTAAAAFLDVQVALYNVLPDILLDKYSLLGISTKIFNFVKHLTTHKQVHFEIQNPIRFSHHQNGVHILSASLLIIRLTLHKICQMEL